MREREREKEKGREGKKGIIRKMGRERERERERKSKNVSWKALKYNEMQRTRER
jgi:hypothetical protein